MAKRSYVLQARVSRDTLRALDIRVEALRAVSLPNLARPSRAVVLDLLIQLGSLDALDARIKLWGSK